MKAANDKSSLEELAETIDKSRPNEELVQKLRELDMSKSNSAHLEEEPASVRDKVHKILFELGNMCPADSSDVRWALQAIEQHYANKLELLEASVNFLEQRAKMSHNKWKALGRQLELEKLKARKGELASFVGSRNEYDTQRYVEKRITEIDDQIAELEKTQC